ncbi:hypothetical protein C8Q72DRAFT_791522 [Fomitopsis betulina]|nr:hypothetical protein C8Q72DRAFT_791522 [Fomitopsis betulina]
MAAPMRHAAQINIPEDDLNDSGEDLQDSNQEDVDEEEVEDHEQCCDFEAETSGNLPVGGLSDSYHNTSGSSSRRSSSASVGGPPTTDYEDTTMVDGQSPEERPSRSRYAVASRILSADESSQSDNASEEEARVKQPAKKQLQAEMPQIRESHTGSAARPVHTSNADMSEPSWLLHTNLILKKGSRSYHMDIKPQNADIQAVLKESYVIGDRLVTLGDAMDILVKDLAWIMVFATPMQKDGLNKIAQQALIKAADIRGYDGEFDIADHLECGSYQDYIKPLVAYVSHRLSCFRAAIKKTGVTSIVHQHFRLVDSHSADVPNKADLLRDLSYIYPWSAESGFDRRAPYEAPYIRDAIRSSFFSITGMQYLSVGSANIAYFASSSLDAPSEKEIAPMMLALCMTAQVESVISDAHLQLDKASDFKAISAPAYCQHLVKIVDFHANKPKRYHHIMHNLFQSVTYGPAIHDI